MNRRGFLGALLGAAVADPERLLWVPGKRLISIPPPARYWFRGWPYRDGTLAGFDLFAWPPPPIGGVHEWHSEAWIPAIPVPSGWPNCREVSLEYAIAQAASMHPSSEGLEPVLRRAARYAMPGQGVFGRRRFDGKSYVVLRG